MTVMPSALDSLEAAFAKEVLQLTDADYGFLVSVSGAGIIAGRLSMCSLIKNAGFFIDGNGLFIHSGRIYDLCFF